MIKGVIFHLDALNVPAGHPKHAEMLDLLQHLQTRGVQTAVFTTHGSAASINKAISGLGLPQVNHVINQKQVGAYKGSPLWIDVACRTLGVQSHELLYIGGSAQDWRTAINTPVFYVQGAWSSPMDPKVSAALSSDSPHEIITFLDLFLDQPPSYAYTLDGTKTPTYVRCMLPNNVSLMGDKGSFSLQDILTYDAVHTVNGNDARHVLMLSLLSALYAEGLLSRQGNEKFPIFTIYPSSNPANVNSHFTNFMSLASKGFRGRYIPDLLERHTAAVDTSKARAAAYRTGKPSGVDVLTHANTVRLNPAHRKALGEPRLVVVLDDFCNTGLSLDWARLLLHQTGAPHRLVLASVGKYKQGYYDVHTPVASVVVDPYAATTSYTASDFTRSNYTMAANSNAEPQMQSVFNSLLRRTPHPFTGL